MNERFEFLRKDYVQGFPAFCGFEVHKVEYGLFESILHVRPEHTQQDGFVHAGVISSMADHTAGYAAFTTVSEQFRILTIEFKINFLKPAKGNTIVCRSQVIKEGRTIIISESEIFSIEEEQEKRISKALVTLMAVPVENLSELPSD